MDKPQFKKWYCYLLLSEDNKRTYVGATIDIHRRLRQHNGEISGGAKATRGSSWRRVCYIEGFPDECATLQFEWKWKNLSKKEKGSAMERRELALNVLLSLEKPTAKAVPYSEYEGDLIVHWENQLSE